MKNGPIIATFEVKTNLRMQILDSNVGNGLVQGMLPIEVNLNAPIDH